MRVRVVPGAMPATMLVYCLCTASSAIAQDAGSENLPLPPITITIADLQSTFLNPRIKIDEVPLAAPRPDAAPRRPDALFPLYTSLIVLQGLDIYSTRRAITSGSAREANPAMRDVVNNGAAFIAVKAGATAGVIWASEKMWKKNRKGAVIFATVVNAAMVAIVANNYRVSR